MIDHERQLIFVHISRTGGTSIESALVGNDWWEIDPRTKHLRASQAMAVYGRDIWTKYITFSVVRNPWDRLVSMWATGWWHRPSGLHQNCRFAEFVHRVGPHPNETCGTLKYCEILDLEVDYLLRFETLQADFAQMLGELELPAPELPHVEARVRPDYRELFDAEAIRRASDRFGSDIEKYGYRW